MNERTDIRILVVDDSALYRKIITEILEELPGIEVVGTARNGRVAMSSLAELQPDLLTLDLEMPEMDGLEVLKQLSAMQSKVKAVMLSAHTWDGAEVTLRALELGAFDFVLKPDGAHTADNKEALRLALAQVLASFSKSRGRTQTTAFRRPRGDEPFRRPRPAWPLIRAVGIGVSTGGPAALARMIPQLPADLGISLFIVQHMPPVFTRSLADRLDRLSRIAVKEAVEGESVRKGMVYVAPGGKQMKVERDDFNNRELIRISNDPPENNCRPSADYLFRSLASCYQGAAAGLIMTGMGHDGTKGLQAMKEHGALIIAQDEHTSTVYSMPKRPLELGLVDVVVPLEALAGEICRTVGRSYDPS